MASHGTIDPIKGQSAPQIFPANHVAIKSTSERSADEINTIMTPESALKTLPRSTPILPVEGLHAGYKKTHQACG